MTKTVTFYLLLCIVFYAKPAFSQNNVEGRIKDGNSNTIDDAAITMHSASDTLFVRGCVSADGGRFQIKDLPSGDYTLSVSCLGFSPYTTSISLDKSIVLDDIVLKERSESLGEIVVKGSSRTEKSDRSILVPTALEKKHAVNGFDLLAVMQIPELDISSDAGRISTVAGGEVVVCIDGMEVRQEEMKTLLSRNVQKIEYVRTPSGRYAGKAGLINIITRQKDFGGNIYLSVKQGFTYKNGDYTAFTDFTKKKWTFSLTASGDWSRYSSYTEGKEHFTFADGRELSRTSTNNSSLYKDNNQAIRLKVTSMGEKYRFNSYISLARQEHPGNELLQNTSYSGFIEDRTEKKIFSSGENLSPAFYANYSVSLPHSQSFGITATASFGKNRYSSQYEESNQSDIISMVDEDNYGITGDVMYEKSFRNNMSFSVTLSHDHMTYKDIYSGSATGTQKLSTDLSQGLLQISQSDNQYYYYLSAGVSNSHTVLNGGHYNYCNPVVFYGGNYAFNSSHSLNLNGYFSHTMFDPSNKNSMTVQKSFFESVQGNPDAEPLKAYGNIISYNGQFGNFALNASYNGYMYFDNIVHKYHADNDIIYVTSVNDGTFYGNMFTATLSYRAFGNRLRLSATAIEEYNMVRGNIYNMSKNILRARFSAAYLWGDWMIKLNYRTPYKAINIRGPYFTTNRPVYELQVDWTHKSWNVEAMVRNPFSKFNTNRITMDYGCYEQDTRVFSEPDGCNIAVKLTYSFSYGKKSERGDVSIDKSTRDAILKGY